MNKEKKPLKILFDHQIFDIQKVGGISRMYSDIAKNLNEDSEFEVKFAVEHTENEYIKDLYTNSNVSNSFISIKHLEKGDFDVFYPTFFNPYFLKYIGKKPFVMSVHDMLAEIYEDLFSRNDMQIVGRKAMVKFASAIEVPSETTKKDLIRILGVDEEKIHVVGRALDPAFGKEYYSENIFNCEYILYVGARGGYKRFDWFAKHISSFLKNHENIHLICTGKNFNREEQELLNTLGILDRCHTMFVDDKTLATLYKHAKFFVFSSEYEGFGLPILEAYKMGCIALLNNCEIFREVTFGKGTFFNLSDNESDISEVAEKIYSMTENERNEVIKIQNSILEKHSFEEYLNKFKNIFKKVAEENNVAICCIGRRENTYIKEYVEYYKNLGVDNIFLYDNNYDGEEIFEDVINDYIEDGFVKVINFRNKSNCQLEAYQDCYDKYGKDYDWILFIDCGDEYLHMEGFDNIKDFLSQDKFKNYEVIHINLMNYGDNDIVKYDGRKLSERFVKPIYPLNFKKTYDFPENDHISSIVRGKLNNVEWKKTPHTPSNELKCCDASGQEQKSTSPFVHPFNFTFAHFKHYTTKTIQEWLDIKVKRGYPDGNKDYFLKHDRIDEFFRWNKRTKEKEEYIEKILENEKINILIVNYNTQRLTDACINSINKHTKDTSIYVFDNSDKEPFINTFDNVKIIDNTKGQIINFDEWLEKYPTKNQMSNNYGSAKHTYTVEKFMQMFDRNFILIDSDVLVKKDISELYDDRYIFVGEKLNKLSFWRERIAPYICFINNKMCKKNDIHFFDENRCTQISKEGYAYDSGASFLDDASKFNHKFINCDDYIVHYGAGSWLNSNKANIDEWINKYRNLWDDVKEGNLDIYICTHRDFDPIVKNEAYKIINCNDINNDTWNGFKGSFYSEIMSYFYIAKNYKLKDYIGFCHYRKYWKFMDDIPDMDEVFKECDLIAAKPRNGRSNMREEYKKFHNIDDLNIIEDIIEEKYPEYKSAFKSFLYGNIMFPYNMFIMKKNDFLNYCNFIEGILNEYVNVVGHDIVKRIEDNKNKYLKDFYPNNTIDYQYRIAGYLAERLTTVFIYHNFERIKTYNVIITEDKYKK
jgi:disulfide oxidoreductase YuzD